MKPSELRALTIRELAPLLAPLGFEKWVRASRDFRRATPFGWQAVFLDDILHAHDVHFSVSLKVRFEAIQSEFARALGEAGHPVYTTLGIEIGYLDGKPGRRYAVHAPEEAASVAARIARDVERAGLPGLARLSDLREVYAAIRTLDKPEVVPGLIMAWYRSGALAVALARLYEGDAAAEAVAAHYRAKVGAIPDQGPGSLARLDRLLTGTDGGRTLAHLLRGTPEAEA